MLRDIGHEFIPAEFIKINLSMRFLNKLVKNQINIEGEIFNEMIVAIYYGLEGIYSVVML